MAKDDYGVYQEMEGTSASWASPTSLATCSSPPDCPFTALRCRTLWPPLCPGPSLSARAAGGRAPHLQLSAGMMGSPPPGDAPASLPLASRPFQPVFMSLSVLCGRPRCQASFTQLPSSRDTMLASESLHWAQIETLSWQGFRAKSSLDTVRNSLPS